MKKMPGDVIILHICTKNYDQMKYGSWDMVHDRRTEGPTAGKSDIQVGTPPKHATTKQQLHNHFKYYQNNLTKITMALH